jgi:type VI secretion system protein ImpA
MAAESALDIETLLQPIPGEKPAGDATAYPYRLREQLLSLRQEERPEDFDDATRPDQLKRADFPGIVRLATTALTEETKDVRLACHLIEALTRTRGFAGLRDGLCLLRRLLDECWDRLEPSIDDGDLDARASPIVNLLDDPDRGFCFPNTVRLTPIFAGQSVLSWQKILAKKTPDDEKTAVIVQAQATQEALAEPQQNIAGCLEELDQLLAVMDDKFQGDSPSLTNFRKALEDAQRMVAHLMPRPAPTSAEATPESTDTPAQASTPASASAPPPPTATASSTTDLNQLIVAREEVYGQLTRAAEMLARLEPHSPIPYLVRRAVDLGKLPFPQLVQQLVREERILADLQREFGLNPPSSTA